MVSSGINDVAIASEYSKKTLLLLWINRKKQRFLAAPVINFRYETKARKVTVDFNCDAL